MPPKVFEKILAHDKRGAGECVRDVKDQEKWRSRGHERSTPNSCFGGKRRIRRIYNGLR